MFKFYNIGVMTTIRSVLAFSLLSLVLAYETIQSWADEGELNLKNSTISSAIDPEFAPWGFDLSGLNTNIRPGNDFYDYANGAWARSVNIAPDARVESVLSAAREITSDVSAVLIEDIIRQEWPEGSDEEKFQKIYSSYLDRSAVNRLGRRPIRAFLRKISRSWTRNELTSTLGSFRLDIGGLFAVRVRVDPRNGQSYLTSVEPARLLLGTREVYLHDDPLFEKRREDGIVLLAGLLDEISRYDANIQRVEDVIALETRLARLYPSRQTLRDPDQDNVFLGFEDLKALEPRFNWKAYFKERGVGVPEIVHVRLGGNLEAIVTEFRTTPMRVWRDYLRLRLMTSYGAYLSEPIVQKVRTFRAMLNGVEPEVTSVEQEAGRLAMSLMPDVVGRAFIRQHGDLTNFPEVNAMADAIKSAYRRRIEKADWLSTATRHKAIEKLDAVAFLIGGPDAWNHYGRLPAREDSLLHNVYWARQIKAEATLSRLGQVAGSPDSDIGELRSHLFFSPLQVGAYYVQRLNTVIIPTSYLQPPFYHSQADMAVNFGALGTTIGHELGHAFDDQGSKYGPSGQLTDWWQKEDRARFDALGERLGAEFAEFTAYKNIKVDPDLTLGESLSDLAGLEIAYEAFREFAKLDDLPALERKEAQQRFLLGYAQKRRSVRRPSFALELALTGAHAPPVHRVNGIVPHFDVWYEAFDISPDDALWRAPEDRLTVW